MKKLLIVLALILPSLLYAQPVENKSSREIKDLKDCVDNYCMMVMNVSLGLNSEIITPDIEINVQNIVRFVDESGVKKKFSTITEVLNYMFRNGWELKFVMVIGIHGRYIFEKRSMLK